MQPRVVDLSHHNTVKDFGLAGARCRHLGRYPQGQPRPGLCPLCCLCCVPARFPASFFESLQTPAAILRQDDSLYGLG
jgi:hypothetical protein